MAAPASETAVARPTHVLSPGFRRLLWLLLPALGILAAAVYLPRLWTQRQEASLRRMNTPELERFVKAQPQNLTARYLLGLAYAKENRNREAAQEFLAVLEQEPHRAEVLNDLGVVYLLQERYYESLVALQGATTAKPDFAAAWANLGRLHLATKMPFTATRELERATQLDPRSVPTLCDLGEAYQRTLNLNGAEDAYRRALQLEPASNLARIGLAKTLYSRGKYDQAEQELTQAQAQTSDDPQILLTLARIRLEKARTPDDLRGARDLLRRAERADPGNPDALYDQGRVAMRLNETPEAITLFQNTLRVSPQHQGALGQLERALRKAGRTAEADRVGKVFRTRALQEREETQLEERISHHPDDWDAQARLTELYLQSGKRGLATLVCLRLQKGKPDHPRLPALLRQLGLSANSNLVVP